MSKGDISELELAGLSEAELLELSELIDPDVSYVLIFTCIHLYLHVTYIYIYNYTYMYRVESR